MEYLVSKGVLTLVLFLHVGFVLPQTTQSAEYFVTFKVPKQSQLDFPKVASIIKQDLCLPKQTKCKYMYKIIGEDTIIAALEVEDPIQLEKRLNVIKLIADVNIKTERLTNYGAFAKHILKVDNKLLVPSQNTPTSDDQVVWCEVKIDYKGLGMLCTLRIKHQLWPYKCVSGKGNLVRCAMYFFRSGLSSAQPGVGLAQRGHGLLDGENIYSRGIKLLFLLCQEEIPHTTKLQPFVEVVESLGVEVQKSLEKGGNAKYTSSQHIGDVNQLFEKTILEDIQQDKQSLPFYTVMVDETTDVNTNC